MNQINPRKKHPSQRTTWLVVNNGRDANRQDTVLYRVRLQYYYTTFPSAGVINAKINAVTNLTSAKITNPLTCAHSTRAAELGSRQSSVLDPVSWRLNINNTRLFSLFVLFFFYQGSHSILFRGCSAVWDDNKTIQCEQIGVCSHPIGMMYGSIDRYNTLATYIHTHLQYT